MALGEKDPEHSLLLRLAEVGAEQEEGERDGDADGDLVKPHELEAEALRQAVGNRAAAHGEHGSELVGPPPEEAEEQRPEESRLEAAEGEHVDEPDEARRRQGDAEDDDTDDGRRHGREAAQLAAYHSKAAASAQVPVDYTHAKNVTKPQGAKPGRVIYVHYKTIFVDPKQGEEKE